MLAQRGSVDDLNLPGYVHDLKIDGVRCIAEVNEGQVVLKSRRGSDITARYPEVVQALHGTGEPGRLVLDCEIAVCDDKGLPSWEHTHKRDAQQSQIQRWASHMPASLFVFDCLTYRGIDMTERPYSARRDYVEALTGQWDNPRLQATISHAAGDALWAVVCEHQLEGVVAKRIGAPYRPGRSRDWIKIKRTRTVTCLVGGFDPGEGSRRDSFGALHLYLLDDKDELVPVGRVGSGFSHADLRRVKNLLGRPPLLVEVEYLDVRSGVLRQPVFKGVREDVEVADATMAQLA